MKRNPKYANSGSKNSGDPSARKIYLQKNTRKKCASYYNIQTSQVGRCAKINEETKKAKSNQLGDEADDEK